MSVRRLFYGLIDSQCVREDVCYEAEHAGRSGGGRVTAFAVVRGIDGDEVGRDDEAWLRRWYLLQEYLRHPNTRW